MPPIVRRIFLWVVLLVGLTVCATLLFEAALWLTGSDFIAKCVSALAFMGWFEFITRFFDNKTTEYKT